MLGRKRFIDETDSAILYIPKKSLKIFTGYKMLTCRKILQFLHADFTNRQIVYMSRRDKEFDKMVRHFMYYDGKDYKKNELAVIYYERMNTFVNQMCAELQKDEWAFVKEQLRWLDKSDEFDIKNALNIENSKDVIKELRDYLKSICGQELDASMQDDFSHKIQEYATKMRTDICKPSRKLGKAVINRFFKENGLKYDIESIKGRRKGEKTKWIVHKL